MQFNQAKSRNQVNILGVKIDNVTMSETVERIEKMLNTDQLHYIVTPNPEFIITAQKSNLFRKILDNADLAIPDGIGILAAAKFFNKDFTKIPFIIRTFVEFLYGFFYIGFSTAFSHKRLNIIKEQVKGSDLIWHIAKQAAKNNWQLFLLGAENGIAKQTAEELTKKHPNLTILDAIPGNPSINGDQETISQLKKQGNIDILLIAYGHPKQELWIARNLKKLNVKVAIGVGAAFDHITGKQKRAPLWLQNHGLEWLWRLITQPWRWKRQLAIIIFVYLVVKEKLSRK